MYHYPYAVGLMYHYEVGFLLIAQMKTLGLRG